MSTGYQCASCGFALWVPIWEAGHVALGLYDDDRFPGRCLLVLKTHREHFDELLPDELEVFTGAAVRIGKVLREVTGAARVNYAVLGNEQAHVHAHLVPRRPAVEPLPRRPPWEDPRARASLGTARLEELRRQIAARLGPGRAAV